MGLSSSTLQPDELVTFRHLPENVGLENIDIPQLPENRRATNVKWLIILGVTILVLLPFMIYTLYHADISRITVGYDKCGNTCGKKNYKWDGINCSGLDFTNSPYLEYENQYVGGWYGQDTYSNIRERRCVQSCKEGYTGIFGRCLQTPHHLNTQEGDVITKHTEEVDLGVYFSSVKWQLIISCLLSILVAIGMLFLFRYAVDFVVWGILIGSFLGMLVLTAVFWYFYDTAYKQNAKSPPLFFGVFFTIMTIVLGIVLIWYRKKIHLVILLLKETTKAVFDMPGLIAITVFSVFAILILTSIFGIITFYMASAGTLQKTMNEYHTYVRNPVMVFTLVYNALVYLWLSQFFTGIQYMIIAGAVAKWYFARDKSYLGSPIVTSMSNAFKFHLGTVAMGALIITIIQVIKAIILSLIKNERAKMFAAAGVNAIERFFMFLSKNAYIITAMHGQAFLKSGKRAAKLIIQNLGDIVAVNYIGDFVLGMAKFLIMIVSVLLSLGIFAIAPGPVTTTHLPSYLLVGVFALVVACIAFGVFETGIDTIFICYCEDKLLNDGMAKPYFMSSSLIEFIEESKEVYGKK